MRGWREALTLCPACPQLLSNAGDTIFLTMGGPRGVIQMDLAFLSLAERKPCTLAFLGTEAKDSKALLAGQQLAHSHSWNFWGKQSPGVRGTGLPSKPHSPQTKLLPVGRVFEGQKLKTPWGELCPIPGSNQPAPPCSTLCLGCHSKGLCFLQVPHHLNLSSNIYA